MDISWYLVAQTGYDHHSENALTEMFFDANGELTRFKDFLVNEGLWENTAILMSSDFGRSLNPNSNSGTDHAVSCAISSMNMCASMCISHKPYILLMIYSGVEITS